MHSFQNCIKTCILAPTEMRMHQFFKKNKTKKKHSEYITGAETQPRLNPIEQKYNENVHILCYSLESFCQGSSSLYAQ